MSTHCRYHPAAPAKWHCKHCNSDFCKQCMPDANEQKKRGNCPLCHQGLRYLGAANTAIPFWERLPEFFKYPLAKDPMVLMAICTFVPMVISSQILAFIVSLILLCVLTKYLFSIIEQTSEGHMIPPSLSSAFTGEGINVLFQQIGVFFIFSLIIAGFGQVGGPTLALIATALILLILPASTITLAIERNIVSAINPLQLTLLIATLGWPYFILYSHILLFFLAMGAGADFLINHAPGMVAYAGVGFINSYFMIIIFHMLGYVLFQYQEKLGFSADEVETTPTHAGQINLNRLDADIDIYLKNGDYKRVKNLLVESLKKNKNDPWRLEQLYRLCLAQRDLITLRPYLTSVLETLLMRNQDQEAISLLKNYYLMDKDYRLHQPDLSYKVAQTAYHLDENKLVLRVLKDFHKHHSDYDRLPEAYILLSRTLANGMRARDKAIAYLNFLLKNYPNYSGVDNIKEMIASLKAGKRI